MTTLATTRDELAAARKALSGRVAAVLTMGALHDGHQALIEAARSRADRVIVTVFVNPLQFGPTEDFDRYPRTLDTDLALCEQLGVDVVFAPARDVVYPDGEPAVRDGVLTVVLKLLQLTRPDLTCFGEKDYQQVALVRRMCRDLDVPVEVVGVPTVREPDGLALSSRNRYLSPPERQAALALSRALAAGAEAGRQGGDSDAVLMAAHDVLAEAAGAEPPVQLDYLALTDPALGPAPRTGSARLLVAARIGHTRLIDNAPVEIA